MKNERSGATQFPQIDGRYATRGNPPPPSHTSNRSRSRRNTPHTAPRTRKKTHREPERPIARRKKFHLKAVAPNWPAKQTKRRPRVRNPLPAFNMSLTSPKWQHFSFIFQKFRQILQKVERLKRMLFFRNIPPKVRGLHVVNQRYCLSIESIHIDFFLCLLQRAKSNAIH